MVSHAPSPITALYGRRGLAVAVGCVAILAILFISLQSPPQSRSLGAYVVTNRDQSQGDVGASVDDSGASTDGQRSATVSAAATPSNVKATQAAVTASPPPGTLGETTSMLPPPQCILLHATTFYGMHNYSALGPVPAAGMQLQGSKRGRTCLLTVNSREYSRNATVSIFHGPSFTSFPNFVMPEKLPGQKWIFSGGECPMSDVRAVNATFTSMMDFNWGYYIDAALSRPYGPPLVHWFSIPLRPVEQRDDEVPVAWLASNCGAFNRREEYIMELMKYIGVASYGKCMNNRPLFNVAAGHDMDRTYTTLSKHKFYLAFENGNCKNYITEKLSNALVAGLIPIVWGPNDRNEYLRWMPDFNSLIFAQDFAGPRELATFLHSINRDDGLFARYVAYRNVLPFPNALYGALPPGGERDVSQRLCDLCHDMMPGTPESDKEKWNPSTATLPDMSCTNNNMIAKLDSQDNTHGWRTIVADGINATSAAAVLIANASAAMTGGILERAVGQWFSDRPLNYPRVPLVSPITARAFGNVQRLSLDGPFDATKEAEHLLMFGDTTSTRPPSSRRVDVPRKWGEFSPAADLDGCGTDDEYAFAHLELLLRATHWPDMVAAARRGMLDWDRYHAEKMGGDSALASSLPCVALRSHFIGYVIDRSHFAAKMPYDRVFGDLDVPGLLRLAVLHVRFLRKSLSDASTSPDALMNSLLRAIGMSSLAHALPELNNASSLAGEMVTAFECVASDHLAGRAGLYLRSPFVHVLLLWRFQGLRRSGLATVGAGVTASFDGLTAASVQLFRPDGQLVRLCGSPSSTAAEFSGLHPHIEWLASRGTRGALPSFGDSMDPTSGYIVFRSPWVEILSGSSFYLYFNGMVDATSPSSNVDALHIDWFDRGRSWLTAGGSARDSSQSDSDMDNYYRSARAHNVVLFDVNEEFAAPVSPREAVSGRPGGRPCILSAEAVPVQLGGSTALIRVGEGRIVLHDAGTNHSRIIVSHPGEWLLIVDEVTSWLPVGLPAFSQSFHFAADVNVSRDASSGAVQSHVATAMVGASPARMRVLHAGSADGAAVTTRVSLHHGERTPAVEGWMEGKPAYVLRNGASVNGMSTTTVATLFEFLNATQPPTAGVNGVNIALSVSGRIASALAKDDLAVQWASEDGTQHAVRCAVVSGRRVWTIT